MTAIDLPVVSLGPVNEPHRAELDAAWQEITTSSSFVLGPAVEAFEGEWARYCGTAEAIGVGSGTEALELILRAMDLGTGAEVIVPASTFIATAAAVVSAGATPVFTDVDPDSLLLTADHVRAALSPRTAAVIPVHLYGNLVDIDAIASVTSPAGVAVIEDAAQAHGAGSESARAGSFGLAAGFSHYPTKNLGAFGDGGSVTTDDTTLATAIRRLRNHGRATQQDVDYQIVGRTGRLHSLQAAILSVKLPSLDSVNALRREIVDWYDDLLPTSIHRFSTEETDLSAPHLCVVKSKDRDRLRAKLAEAGIGSGVHYPDPVPRTAAFGNKLGFPVAEAAADAMLSLPLWPGMTKDQVERVCSVIDQVENEG